MSNDDRNERLNKLQGNLMVLISARTYFHDNLFLRSRFSKTLRELILVNFAV